MLTINLEDDLEVLLNSIADKTHSQPEQVVKELIRHYAENIASFDNDFFDCAGIWKDRDISQATIRATAWREQQP